MPTTASVSVQRRKDINGTRVLDFLDQDFSPTSVTGRYRQAVDSAGNWSLKKDTSGNNTSVFRTDLSIAQTGGLSIGDSASVLPLSYNALTVYGDSLFRGALAPDSVASGVSPYSVGSPAKMWYSGHFAELRVAVLVADEQAVTMGGRQLVGNGNILAQAITSTAATTIRLRYNSFKSGDILYFQGSSDDYVGATEFMRIAAGSAGALSERSADGTYRPFKRIWWDTATNTPTATQPTYDGTAPYAITNAGSLPAGSISVYEVTVARNIEAVANGGNVANASPNTWGADATVFNTGGINDGFIDIYAQNRFLDTPLATTSVPLLSGPSIEFSQRTSTAWDGVATRAVVGRLDGKYGYSMTGNVFGFAAGNAAAGWIGIDPSGVRFMNAGDELGYIRSTGLKIGSLQVAGAVTTIAGWTASANTFSSGTTDIVLDGTGKKITVANGSVAFGYNVTGSVQGLLVTTGTGSVQVGNNLNSVAGAAGFRIDADNFWQVSATNVTTFAMGGSAGITYSAGTVIVGSSTSFMGKVVVGQDGKSIVLNPDPGTATKTLTHTALAIGGTLAATASAPDAPFRVTYAGALTATGATITGVINAQSGTFSGNVNITSGGALQILRDTVTGGTVGDRQGGTALAIRSFQHSVSLKTIGAGIDIISVQPSNNSATRYGLRVFDKPGGKYWIMFHDPDVTPVTGDVATTDASGGMFETYDSANQAKAGTLVLLKNSSSAATPATVPHALISNRLMFNLNGFNKAFITQHGDFVAASRLQVSYDTFRAGQSPAQEPATEGAWGNVAYGGQIRGVWENGEFRPQWFDNAGWRWLDLGNDPNETITTSWGNVSTKPNLKMVQTVAGVEVKVSVDLQGSVAADPGNSNAPTISGLITGLGALAVLGSINNSHWSGTALSLANGGTGRTTITANTFWYASTAGVLSESTISADGRLLLADTFAAMQGATRLDIAPRTGAATVTGAWTFSTGVTTFSGTSVTLGTATTFLMGNGAFTVGNGAVAFGTGGATFGGDITATAGFLSLKRPDAATGLTAEQSTTGLITISFTTPAATPLGGYDGFLVEVQYGGAGAWLPVAYMSELANSTSTTVLHTPNKRISMQYRVYTLKNGRSSAAATYTLALSLQPEVTGPTLVTIAEDQNHFEITWDTTQDLRLLQYKLFVDYAATDVATEQNAITRGAVYTGLGTSARFEIPYANRNDFFKFYVEPITRTS